MDEYFSKGKRGLVFLRTINKKKVIVKKKNPKAEIDTLENEAKFNKLLNKKGIGPKFISYDGKELVREYVVGEELRKWLPKADAKELKKLFLNVLLQCREMDLLGVNKFEMTKPYKNIIVRSDNQPFLIDFERCKDTKKPKNVTQFIQFINSKNIKSLFKEKKFFVNHDSLREFAKKYKDSCNIPKNQAKVFENIINELS